MTLTTRELVDALPPEFQDEGASRPLGGPGDQEGAAETLRNMLAQLSRQEVPVGRLSRMWTLGTLQAKVAAAYLAHFIRSAAAGRSVKDREKNEAHLKSALRVLGTMGYMRGAVMKLGQVFASFPDVMPQEFVDVLGRLFFEAPPMHFAMLREHVRNELGDDPEELFDTFETEAFAAASLGQVHRATLKGSGRPVAVKIQYPNISRAIRDDFKNMMAVSFPMRLSIDWENIKTQVEAIHGMLQKETDYEQEAEHLRIARAAFTEEDRIVVPEVYPELSTRRVLTMEFVPGKHIDEFLATDPSQEVRNEHGRQLTTAMFRMSYGAHLLYADPHPGNFFFMDDGRLGLCDFGCCMSYDEEQLGYVTMIEEAHLDGSSEAIREAMIIAAGDLTPKQQQESDRMEMLERFARWFYEPQLHEGPFDFGDPEYMRRGITMYGECTRKRWTRSHPLNTWITKHSFGARQLLQRLGAVVDMNSIWKRESLNA